MKTLEKGRAGQKQTLRPTLGKVRESVFNILMGRVDGSVFVDLYAGTGAVGMDAMSRGAKAVWFVEADRKRAAEIKKLLEGCGCRPKANIIAMDAEAFIKKASKENLRADIVYLDPPYASDELEKVLPLLSGEGVLADDFAVLAEHSTKKPQPDEAGILKKKKSYRYGDTTLTLYGRKR